MQIPFTDIFCVGYMLSELVAREEDTQLAGLVSITDASGFGIKHVSVYMYIHTYVCSMSQYTVSGAIIGFLGHAVHVKSRATRALIGL